MLGWLSLIVAIFAGLFITVQGHSGEMSAASAGLAAAGVLTLLAAAYLATHSERWHDNRTAFAAAAVVIVLLLAGSAWWTGKDQLFSVLAPNGASSADLRAQGRPGAVSVLIRRNDDGKYIAQGQINGVAASLLVDTGAGTVMLKHSDAEKAGIDVQGLSFSTPIQTANGTVYAAPVRVRAISIGLLRLQDIEALVAKPGSLNENLLGISFLRRLSSYDIHGDFLTLRE